MAAGVIMRVLDQCTIKGIRFAILVDDETGKAYEAVWIDSHGWDTDFRYPVFGLVTWDEVIEAFGIDSLRRLGYRFD